MDTSNIMRPFGTLLIWMSKNTLGLVTVVEKKCLSIIDLIIVKIVCVYHFFVFSYCYEGWQVILSDHPEGSADSMPVETQVHQGDLLCISDPNTSVNGS